jgi:hypothetical protein
MAALFLAVIPNMPGLANSVTPSLYVPQGAKDLYTMSWLVGFVLAATLHPLFHYLFPVPIDPPGGGAQVSIGGIEEYSGSNSIHESEKKGDINPATIVLEVV